MSARRARSWGVLSLALALLTAAAAAYGPVGQVLLIQEAAERAAEANRHEPRPQGDDTSDSDARDDDPVFVVLPQCEWDRVVKPPPRGPTLRVLAAAGAVAVAAGPQHPPRFEIARQSPSPAAILATSGMPSSHAAHAPPGAGHPHPTGGLI